MQNVEAENKIVRSGQKQQYNTTEIIFVKSFGTSLSSLYFYKCSMNIYTIFINQNINDIKNNYFVMMQIAKLSSHTNCNVGRWTISHGVVMGKAQTRTHTMLKYHLYKKKLNDSHHCACGEDSQNHYHVIFNCIYNKCHSYCQTHLLHRQHPH